jgi:hypothetical protein
MIDMGNVDMFCDSKGLETLMKVYVSEPGGEVVVCLSSVFLSLICFSFSFVFVYEELIVALMGVLIAHYQRGSTDITANHVLRLLEDMVVV